MSVTRPEGERNDDPSMRAMTVSSRSVRVLALGGGAGNSIRSMLSMTIASTTAVIKAVVVARLDPPPPASTGAGMAAASASMAASLSRAGAQRTAASTSRPSGRFATRIPGTIAPRAVTRTPSRATRPIHRTLAPIPSLDRWPPSASSLARSRSLFAGFPTATSHPNASLSGMASASASSPPGSGTPRCSIQPPAGAPEEVNRCRSASSGSEQTPGPPVHTTSWPSSHEACSRTSASSRSVSGSDCDDGSSVDGRRAASSSSGGRSMAAVASRFSSVSVRSATTWPRSSPGSLRTDATFSSASSIRRSSTASDSRVFSWNNPRS